MKSGDYRLTVENIRAGQPRPYADSIYEFTIFAEWIPYGKTELEPVKWIELIFISHAKGISYFKLKTEKREWHEKYLDSVVKVGEGKYKFIIIEPFTD